jgi:hypothetical protein
MSKVPRLPDDSEAEIERAREAVISTRHEKFPILFEQPFSAFRAAMSGELSAALDNPRPPKFMPATLRVEIRDYVYALFDAEAQTLLKHAENEMTLRIWLHLSGTSIQLEVNDVTTKRSQLHDLHCPLEARLEIIRVAVMARIEYWIEASKTWPLSTRKSTVLYAVTDEEFKPPQITASVNRRIETHSPDALPTDIDSLIATRSQRLAEYKAATGHPSNKSIYTASNSSIHKPQFHEWQRGDLSPNSQTCINFERFLREKRRPIPKASKA